MSLEIFDFTATHARINLDVMIYDLDYSVIKLLLEELMVSIPSVCNKLPPIKRLPMRNRKTTLME